MGRLAAIVGGLLFACAVGVVAGATFGASEKTTTVTEVATVTTEAPPPPQPTKPTLATEPRRPGEIIVDHEQGASLGPFAFRSGGYRVRYAQYAPEDPEIDFRTGSSSFVAQLRRKSGEIDGDTVHIMNVTRPAGETHITTAGGKYYVDVEADHSYVLRFTPE